MIVYLESLSEPTEELLTSVSCMLNAEMKVFLNTNNQKKTQ